MLNFGFEICGHPGKFFYMWVDAPIGYRASLANWCDKNGQDINAWWPGGEVLGASCLVPGARLKHMDGRESNAPSTTHQAPSTELYHFIGKDIIRFHCLFWPGMLHVAGIRTPDKVFVHGFLTVNGEKRQGRIRDASVRRPCRRRALV